MLFFTLICSPPFYHCHILKETVFDCLFREPMINAPYGIGLGSCNLPSLYTNQKHFPTQTIVLQRVAGCRLQTHRSKWYTNSHIFFSTHLSLINASALCISPFLTLSPLGTPCQSDLIKCFSHNKISHTAGKKKKTMERVYSFLNKYGKQRWTQMFSGTENPNHLTENTYA